MWRSVKARQQNREFIADKAWWSMLFNTCHECLTTCYHIVCYSIKTHAYKGETNCESQLLPIFLRRSLSRRGPGLHRVAEWAPGHVETGEDQDTVMQMSSTETPLSRAGEVATPRVEWALTPSDGAKQTPSHIQQENHCLERVWSLPASL